jgi:hypothetical protein
MLDRSVAAEAKDSGAATRNDIAILPPGRRHIGEATEL